jgi:hypothetical protein
MLDDEMPQAPEAAAGTPQVTIDDQIDASLFDNVPKMGDALPAGVYSVRLKQFSDAVADDGAVYFKIQWSVTQEPHVGRVFFDNIPWVSKTDVEQAKAGNPQAQAVLSERLPRSKAVMEAAGFKPSGKFGFKEFMGTNPELKVQVTINERKQKDAKGAWVGTGEMGNKIQKYISLVATR